MTTLYSTLGVTPGASYEAIRARYRELALIHHPDRGGDCSVFAGISEAGATLLDEDRRRHYDASLRLLMDACPKCDGKGYTTVQLSFTNVAQRRCEACQGEGFLERRFVC